MKKYLFAIVGIATCLYTGAQVSLPAPSSAQTIIQDFGMGKIELTYSRPSIKGRKLFMDNSDLAPLGKLWRTGANAPTRLHFSDFVNMGGKDLDSGSYVLYTIPGKTEWEIILNKGINNWGTEGYKENEDVVRFKVPVSEATPSAETFTMQFANITPESCDLYIRWGITLVKVPVTTKIKERLRAQIETALQGDKKPYQQAANFYFEWDKDYAKALDNVNKGIDENKNAFWLYLLKAKIQKAAGDKRGAEQNAEKCIELATAAKNDDYVKQASDLIKSL